MGYIIGFIILIIALVIIYKVISLVLSGVKSLFILIWKLITFPFHLIYSFFGFLCHKKHMYSLRRNAKHGDTRAMLELAKYYESLKENSDWSLAVNWYNQAAQAGNYEACMKLAEIYKNGEEYAGTDLSRSMMYVKLAAQSSDRRAVEAMEILANASEYGKGIPCDIKNAIYWYEKAGEKGNLDAYRRLAVIYDVGIGGINSDEKIALQWFEKGREKSNIVDDFLGIFEDMLFCGVMNRDEYEHRIGEIISLLHKRYGLKEMFFSGDNTLGELINKGSAVCHQLKNDISIDSKSSKLAKMMYAFSNEYTLLILRIKHNPNSLDAYLLDKYTQRRIYWIKKSYGLDFSLAGMSMSLQLYKAGKKMECLKQIMIYGGSNLIVDACIYQVAINIYNETINKKNWTSSQNNISYDMELKIHEIQKDILKISQFYPPARDFIQKEKIEERI